MDTAALWIMGGVTIVCICGWLLHMISQPSPMVKEWEKQKRGKV